MRNCQIIGEMNKKTIDMIFLNDLLDALGVTAFLSALFLNFTGWILNVEWNSLLTGLISLAGFVYIIYKIYDVRLSIKQRKKDLEL